MKTELLYGIHPVEEALKAGRRICSEVLVARGRQPGRIAAIRERAAQAGLPVREVAPDQLKGLVRTGAHQGIAARVSPLPLLAAADLVRPGIHPFLLALDCIVDPQNLGALIRTGACVGAGGVLVPRDRSAPLSSAVSKASAGALEHMAVAQVVNMARALEQLKEMGLWAAGLAMDGERTVFEADFRDPLVLVIGGEARGIRPNVRRQCDFLLTIPQTGIIDSLNASVAGGVAMYEVYRQREGGTRR